MTDTNQLPEPELGYIKTDKSNQPAFSARQMREAMKHALQARAQVQGEPVTVAVDHFDNGPFEAYTNRIHPPVEIGAKLYTTPQTVPMTPASRDVIMATRTANADADEWPEPWAYQRGWNDAEANHGINAQAKEAEAQQPATPEPVVDVRCEGCGYMTHHREHMGCVRAAKQHTHPAPSVPADVVLDCYDAGILNDFGGGNVEWWQDYIRAELGRAHDFYQSQIDAAMLAAK